MKNIIKIESGKRFLSDYYEKLPSNCLLDKGITGCGGTTVELKSKRNSIICVPNISLVQNKMMSEFSESILGVYGDITNAEINKYFKKKIDYRKIIVTYDSLLRVVKFLGELVYNDYFLLIDEYHILFNSYIFRNSAIRNILDNFNKFKNFCFMTATPLDEFNILEELKSLPIIKIQWEDATPVDIEICDTYYIMEKLKSLINAYNDIDCNLHIFINSVKTISNIIRKMKLFDYRIVCSKDNASKYQTLNCEDVNSSVKKVNFYTSTCFEGVDIYDPIGKTIVVSDSNISTTMMDISTLFVQICGRLRNSIYKNKITFIVNTKNHRYCRFKNENEFMENVKFLEYNGLMQIERFNNQNDEMKNSDLFFYSKEKLMNGYVIYKEQDNILKHDPNLKNCDIKNYQIVHKMYSTSLSVLDNVNSDVRLNAISIPKKEFSQEEIIKQVQKSFNYKNFYTYKEITDILKYVLYDYGIFYKKTEIRKYINYIERQMRDKNGKKIRLYELIK